MGTRQHIWFPVCGVTYFSPKAKKKKKTALFFWAETYRCLVHRYLLEITELQSREHKPTSWIGNVAAARIYPADMTDWAGDSTMYYIIDVKLIPAASISFRKKQKSRRFRLSQSIDGVRLVS